MLTPHEKAETITALNIERKALEVESDAIGCSIMDAFDAYREQMLKLQSKQLANLKKRELLDQQLINLMYLPISTTA